MPEMYLRLDLRILFVDHLLKVNKEYKNWKQHNIQDTFIKAN